MTNVAAETPSKFNLTNHATGKPKRNSMWRGDKQRPLPYWMSKKDTKKKAQRDPYERLPAMTHIFKVYINNVCVGMTFEASEAKSWVKDSKEHISLKRIEKHPYVMPSGLSHAGN